MPDRHQELDSISPDDHHARQHAHDGSDGSGSIDHGDLTGLTTGDPHTQYQQESAKGQANGYASLDGSGDVPDAQIPATIARDSELHAEAHDHDADALTPDTLAVESTDDATSSTAAPLKSAGGLAVAKQTYFGDRLNYPVGAWFGGGASTRFQRTASVSTVATTIATGGADTLGCFLLISGREDTNRFLDVVVAGSLSTAVIQSLSTLGSPVARTYSVSGQDLQLALASGTYEVFAVFLRLQS